MDFIDVEDVIDFEADEKRCCDFDSFQYPCCHYAKLFLHKEIDGEFVYRSNYIDSSFIRALYEHFKKEVPLHFLKYDSVPELHIKNF